MGSAADVGLTRAAEVAAMVMIGDGAIGLAMAAPLYRR